jgi:hypothetical protein
MAATNKIQKTDHRKHFGRGGDFLKNGFKKMKGAAFYNAATRGALKSELRRIKQQDD